MLFFLSLGFQASAQPANDLCANAATISCGTIVSGTNQGATTDAIPACGSLTLQKHGVWYKLVGSGDEVTLSTCGGTNFDTQLAVFTGSCGSFSCVAGNNNDYDCTFQRASTVTFIAVNGTTYYVLVTGVLGARGNFNLSVNCGEPIGPGDACATALDIACGDDPVSGSTVGRPVQSVAFCGTSGNTAPGVWYKLTGTGTTLTATTCNAGSNYDTKLLVFTGTCNGLVCVGGDDDDPSCGLSSLRSSVEFDAEEDQDYYILVTGFSSNAGNYTLSIEGSCDPAPPCVADGVYNNVCDADCLTLGALTPFSNVGATAQAGEPNPGAGTVGTSPSCDATDGWCSFELDVDNSVWFTFTAPASGCVDIDVLDADLQLAVWAVGDCGNFATFTEVGANDDGGPGFAPILTNLAVTPGQVYYVQIDGYNGAVESAGTVMVSDCSAVRTAQNAPSSTLTIKDFNPDFLAVGDLYPNPVVDGVTNMNINAIREVEAQVQLFDQTGKLMQQSKHVLFSGVNTLQLDVTGYAAGLYYAVVRIDSEIFQKKLVVTTRP